MPVCPTCSAEVRADIPCPHCGAAGRPDVLTSDGPVSPETRHGSGAGAAPRGRARGAVAVLAGLLTVGVAGAAVYAGTTLGGGGTQPEDVLPADVIGFVKLDLDPSAGQKLAAYRLAQHFPDSGVTGEDSLRDDLLDAVLDGKDQSRYDEHVKPWLGARAGVAWLPPADDASGPRMVAAVQVTDRKAAEQGLTALREDEPEGAEVVQWAFAPGDDYVLLSSEAGVAEQAAGTGEHLADDEHFVDAVAALDGDQIVLGWVDLAAAWRALPERERAQAVEETPGLAPEGTVVVGAHVDDDGVEVLGRSLGMSAGDAPELQALMDTSLGRTEPTGLVEQLPGDSAVAFGLTGLGEGMSQLWTTFADETAKQEAAGVLSEYGVRLPDDFEALLGSELAVGVAGAQGGGLPRVDLRVATADPERAVELLEQARAAAGASGVPGLEQVEVRSSEAGYAVHFPAGQAAGAGELGSSGLFTRTVPDADSSGITSYADVARVLQLAGNAGGLTAQQRRNLEPVKAVGYTARLEDGGDGTFRMRVTVD